MRCNKRCFLVVFLSVLLLCVHSTGQVPPIERQERDQQPKVYRFTSRWMLFGCETVGVTRNIEYECVRVRSDEGWYAQRITALQGNQFRLCETLFIPNPNPARPAPEPRPVDKMIGAHFRPGDSGIRIKVNPDVGHTALYDLRFLDPVVIAIHEDGLVEADREGVRASIISQSLGTSGSCSLIHPPRKDEQGGTYYSMKQEVGTDGSLMLEAGEYLECSNSYVGNASLVKAVDQLISRKVSIAGKSLFAFVPNQ